jgi:hypothetical protein
MKTALNLDKNHKKTKYISWNLPITSTANQEFQNSHCKILSKALEIQEHTIKFTQTTDSNKLELSNFEVKTDHQNVITIMTSGNSHKYSSVTGNHLPLLWPVLHKVLHVCLGFTLFFHLYNPIHSAYSAEYGNRSFICRGATIHSFVPLLLLLNKALIIKALINSCLACHSWRLFIHWPVQNSER